MAEVYGCDIGNGMAYISLFSKNTGFRPMLPDEIRLDGMPSIGYLNRDGRIDVYNDIQGSLRIAHPGRFLDSAKSRLDVEVIRQRDGRETVELRPVEFVSAVIRKLVELANESRAQVNQEPIHEVVVTYPATFEGAKDLLGRLREAVERTQANGSRLRVRRMIPEPSAAAISFLSESRLEDGKTGTVIVYDLGHGTFDTALVSAGRENGAFRAVLRHHDGIRELGGKDLNRILYEMALQKLREQNVTEIGTSVQNMIKRDIQALKHSLSENESSSLDCVIDGDTYELVFTAEEFERQIEGKIGQTMEKIQAMLDYAEKEKLKVDMVVLTGGGSRIPLVSRSMKQLLEGTGIPYTVYRPGSAVSCGAAIVAAGFPTEQLVTQGFGIHVPVAAPGDAPIRGALQVMIPRGEKRPVQSSEIDFESDMFPMTIRVMHTDQEVSAGDSSLVGNLIPIDKCTEVQRFNYDFQCKVKVSLSLDENGGITVHVKKPDGTVDSQGTFHKKEGA